MTAALPENPETSGSTSYIFVDLRRDFTDESAGLLQKEAAWTRLKVFHCDGSLDKLPAPPAFRIKL